VRRAVALLIVLAALCGTGVVAVAGDGAAAGSGAISTDDAHTPEAIDRSAPSLRAQPARTALPRAGTATLAAVAAVVLVALLASRLSHRTTLPGPVTGALPLASRAPPRLLPIS
jgi:hypothetical protein